MPRSDFIIFDETRISDSPCIEQVWRCHSEGSGPFLAVASSHWELVISNVRGATSITLHGGELQAREVYCPPDGEWYAIRFRPGTYMPRFPAGKMMNGNDLDLPLASRRRFLLDGRKWEIPSFDNAEVFVARLVKAGMLARDPVVENVLADDAGEMSLRTAQRRFQRAIGMTRARLRTIERARLATILLRNGLAIADVVHEAGYFDQAHLTRALRHHVGLTPREIARGTRQLSFLYKTPP
jgi:AraC-like DNA-binding protein